MHNKFARIGRNTLTGSFNWSKRADEKNRENLVVMTFPVKDYSDEFERLWKDYESETVVARALPNMENAPVRGPPAYPRMSSSGLCTAGYRYSHIVPGPLSDETKYQDIKRCPATGFFGGKYKAWVRYPIY